MRCVNRRTQQNATHCPHSGSLSLSLAAARSRPQAVPGFHLLLLHTITQPLPREIRQAAAIALKVCALLTLTYLFTYLFRSAATPTHMYAYIRT